MGTSFVSSFSVYTLKSIHSYIAIFFSIGAKGRRKIKFYYSMLLTSKPFVTTILISHGIYFFIVISISVSFILSWAMRKVIFFLFPFNVQRIILEPRYMIAVSILPFFLPKFFIQKFINMPENFPYIDLENTKSQEYFHKITLKNMIVLKNMMQKKGSRNQSRYGEIKAGQMWEQEQ